MTQSQHQRFFNASQSDADKDRDITDPNGSLGRFRYLLFDCYVTEVADNFGNTFYSEIDVLSKR
jgi:hypothetical protein